MPKRQHLRAVDAIEKTEILRFGNGYPKKVWNGNDSKAGFTNPKNMTPSLWKKGGDNLGLFKSPRELLFNDQAVKSVQENKWKAVVS